MKIRPALQDDIAGIAAIWNPMVRDTDITFRHDELSDKDLQAYLRDHRNSGDPVFVLVENEEILGFGSYHPFRSGPGYGRTREVSISLSQKIHRAGHGTRLLAALEGHAVSQGIHVLVAGVTETNATSLHFFSHVGYAIVGRMPQVGWKFDRWHNLVLMQKIL